MYFPRRIQWHSLCCIKGLGAAPEHPWDGSDELGVVGHCALSREDVGAGGADEGDCGG